MRKAMNGCLKNEDGAILLQVIAMSLLLGMFIYSMATYNANLRVDTSNKMKRYVKKDLELIIQQNVLQADALMRSERIPADQTFP